MTFMTQMSCVENWIVQQFSYLHTQPCEIVCSFSVATILLLPRVYDFAGRDPSIATAIFCQWRTDSRDRETERGKQTPQKNLLTTL